MSSAPQIVCQVCGTRQDNAWDCAFCGSALHDKPRHWEVPVAPLPDLEPTAVGDGGNVAVPTMPDLEPTAVGAAPEPLPDWVPELEPTAFGEVGQVPVEPLPDVEPTAVAEPATPAAAMGSTTCRYCGTPWAPGGSIFCGRCGMRVGLATQTVAAADEDSATCTSCGRQDQPIGGLCAGCHTRVRR